MKKHQFVSLLFAGFLAVISDVSSAKANIIEVQNTNIVRTAQIRLSALGYNVNELDGKLGPVTQRALMQFQANNHLAVTGELTPETFQSLSGAPRVASIDDYYRSYDDYYRLGHLTHVITPQNTSFVWDDNWHSFHSHDVSLRYAQLGINEENVGTARHYTVNVNGNAVLFATNQPGILRASQVFSLPYEDAVIFTAYQNDSTCPNKSFLLVVRSDGSYNKPTQIGNCAGSYNARIVDNALVVDFPMTNYAYGVQYWDTWSYKNDTLIRG